MNRRTVVDQSTAEAEKLQLRLRNSDREDIAHEDGIVLKTLAGDLRKLCAFRDDEVGPLAISTLRGQFADNGEWCANPARPALIVGTVDMIGSRLLFSGYNIGFKAKPLHAGFLGQDVLLVHDEAHLEPAFQKLLEKVELEQRQGEGGGKLPWPKLRIMALTATARNGKNAPGGDSGTFELTPEERQPPMVLPDPPTLPIHRVWRRLKREEIAFFSCCQGGKGCGCKKNRRTSRRARGPALQMFLFSFGRLMTSSS